MAIELLTGEDYKNLLAFSNSLDPYQIDFRRSAMNQLLKFFPFDGAAFPLVDDQGYYKHLIYVNFTSTSIESYEKDCYKKDFFAPANLKKLPEKSVLTVEDFFSYPDYESSSLYSQCLHFNGFYYEGLVLLRDEIKNPLGAVAVYHGKHTSGFTKREQKILEEVGAIMEKATKVHLDHLSLNSTMHVLSNIISRYPVGMIVCDEQFHIQEINCEMHRILESHGLNGSQSNAQKLLLEQILPAYQKNHSTRFTLPIFDSLQVHFETVIEKDPFSDRFISRYIFFLSDMHRESRNAWMNYLNEKGLTRRECEVADLLCGGNELEFIADQLSISINTVKRHKESIYSKLLINRSIQLLILHQKINNLQ
jgi:DNA-binding CsgD family transcriptional regulator